MKGFARSPALAGAVVALGVLGVEARAGFLVQADATLNARGDHPGSVAGSDITLTATYAPAAGAPASSDVIYTWTLGFAHDTGLTPGAAPSYNLMSQVTGDVSLDAQVPTTGGFTQPVIGFFTLGSTVYFQLAGTIAPSGLVTTGDFNVGVSVNTATSTIDIEMLPNNGTLGPISVAGSFTAVPEPATIALMGAGGLLLLIPRFRRRLRRAG